MNGKRVLLRGGSILTMDPAIGDLERGDVLIEGRRIAAIEPTIQVDVDEIVDAEGMLVLPGLIDSHIHLWQAPLRGLSADCYGDEYFSTIHPVSGRYRPEDMYAATYAGSLELLLHGVTTAFDFCHSVHSPEHADASVAALRAAGIRALYGYSFRDRPELDRRAFHSFDDRLADAHRVRSQHLSSDDDLVGMAIALNDIDVDNIDSTARELACARELGVMATVHSGTTAREVTTLHERGLLGPDVQWVHAYEISDEELDLLADHGGSIAATPEIEIGMASLYPITGRGLRRGVPVALGSDVPSTVNGDPLFAARLVFHVERLREGQIARAEGRSPNRTETFPSLSPRGVLKLVTADAAATLGLGSRTGSLTPGKDADVLLLSTEPFGLSHGDPAAHVVLQASAANVDTVIVGGMVRVRGGRLVDVDVTRMRAQLDEARAHLVAGGPDQGA